MDGCLCVSPEMTASAAASHQGTVKAERSLPMSDIFWLNIPVIKEIILSYRSSSINAWDTCIYKNTMLKWAESFPQKLPFNHSKRKKKKNPNQTTTTKNTEHTGNFDSDEQETFWFCDFNFPVGLSVFSKVFSVINIYYFCAKIKVNLKIPP